VAINKSLKFRDQEILPATTIVNESDWWTKLSMGSNMSMCYSIKKDIRQFDVV